MEVELSRLQVGQRLQVEIVSNDSNQEGIISLNGKLIKAKLEAQVQTGDQFWAAVKAADENGIVLSRESLNQARLNNFSAEQLIILFNRGFAPDKEVSDTLAKFIRNETSALLSFLAVKNPQLKNLIAKLWMIIPKWSEMSGVSPGQLKQYYHLLGLDHEKLLYQHYKVNPGKPKPDFESIKALLLKMIEDNSDSYSSEEKNTINKFLEEITGQQLWLNTGAKRNAYCLMHFPLQDNGVLYNGKLAIESSRKGRRMDKEHCHLALQVETPHLGLVGADLIIHEKGIQICILHDNTAELSLLLQKLGADTENGFASLGYKLLRVSSKTFEEYPQFSRFISGKYSSGVDLKG